MKRPVIGLTTYVARAKYAQWDLDAAIVPFRYVAAVDCAGARPVLLPPLTRAASETVDAVDAIMFIGGPDLDPATYGQDPHLETSDVDRCRDDAELLLLRAALDQDLPVLGICRGAQLLNIAFNGSLHQHLPDVVGHSGHKSRIPGRYLPHDVVI